MRILQVMGKINYGGIEAVVFSYLRHIDLTDCEIDVAYGADSKMELPQDIIDRGIKFIKLPPYTDFFGFIKAVKKLSEENKYDIVHSHMGSLSFLPLLGAKKAGVKHRICHNHTTSAPEEALRNFLKNRLKPLAVMSATGYAACSGLAAEWMYGKKAVENGKVKVFNNVIDIVRFSFNESSRRTVKDKYGIKDEYVICHIGRFCSQKNQPFVIEIIKELKKRGIENVKLFMIGNGADKEKIESTARSEGLSDRVIFTDVVSNAEDYYSASDMFILPSLYEGLPVVAVEAQANGLRCLMSDRITTEAELTGLTELLPIDKGASVWCDRIIQIMNDSAYDSSCAYGKRKAYAEIVSDSGFNVVNAAGKLKEYYLEAVSGKASDNGQE